MGSSVGPALATELKSRFNNDVAVQGVDYAASVSGVVVGSMNPAQAEGAKKSAFSSLCCLFFFEMMQGSGFDGL